MNAFVLVAFLFSVSFTATRGISCPPCDSDMWKCTPEDQLSCEGGLAPGACGCCKVCAKLIGEECGGFWGKDGTCDDGLECITDSDPEFGIPLFQQATGRCVPKSGET